MILHCAMKHPVHLTADGTYLLEANNLGSLALGKVGQVLDKREI